jgi:hypothetical protein
MARNCSAAHCSGADAELNEICKSEGWAVSHPVLTRDESGPCQCHCSCLALGTPVAIAQGQFKPIQDFKVGDKVLATGINLQWVEKEVAFSNGTTGASVQPHSVFIEYGNSSLIVTADHLFLMPDKKLKRADRLTINDKLMASNGGELEIKSVSMGTYYGGFHHIATTTEKPNDNLDGHLLDTNGIISADYAVQLYQNQRELDSKLLVDGHNDLPVVGSPEYISKNGVLQEPKEGQKLAFGAFSHHSPPSDKNIKAFVPMSKARVNIPKDAASFISKEQADTLQKYPKRPLISESAHAWADYLVTQFKAFYPAVIYEIDWYNDEVNAYAWRDEQKVGHVALLGGLIRFPAIEIEGLALVLAHELSHLYGGPPYYPGTDLSCEGQADFYGARNIMRVVWFGEYYCAVMDKSIKQLKEFFGLPEFLPKAGAAAGCSHPPGPCRIETYNAGYDLKPKPACAG